MTDSRRVRGRGITPAVHKRIDLGLSTMAASMPQFLVFESEREKRFFRIQSAVIAGIAVLTDFEPERIQQDRPKAA